MSRDDLRRDGAPIDPRPDARRHRDRAVEGNKRHLEALQDAYAAQDCGLAAALAREKARQAERERLMDWAAERLRKGRP